MISKTVECPSCKNHVEIKGTPGERVSVTCPKCSTKGFFKVPGELPETGVFAIEIKNITKTFKELKAVDNISFNVKKGEIFGFLGPNGAGKTTTIKAMLGLIHMDTGEVKINGYDILNEGIKAKDAVGFLPERVSFYENLTPVQTLNFYCELKGVDKSIIPKLLNDLGLGEAMNRKVGTYSKGMVQLLGVAQAVIGNPPVYILDEPMSGLDARWVKIVRERIKKLNEEGATIIFSSHILSEVENLCDRVAIIDKGRIIAENTVPNLNKYLKIKPKLSIQIKDLDGKVPDVIKNLEGVEAVEASGNILFITCESTVRSKAITTLEKAGFEIIDITTINPSLEDAFVKLIDRGEN